MLYYNVSRFVVVHNKYSETENKTYAVIRICNYTITEQLITIKSDSLFAFKN